MIIQRTCGWCQTTNPDATATSCRSCGGPLPALPTAVDGVRVVTLAAEPPPTPRHLPDTYRNRILIWKNVLVLIGGIFTICVGWTGIFALIGIPMLYIGWTRAQGKLRSLTVGRAVTGRVVDVDRDTSVKINNRSPWRITYRYEADGGTHDGWVHAWERTSYEPNDPVWVVWGPEDPGTSSLWPPVV